MVLSQRCRSVVRRTIGRWLLASLWAVLAWCLGTASPSRAAEPDMHYRQHAAMPPGAIGSWQLQRGGPLPGYFQPVEIRAPQGALISLAAEGRFDPEYANPVHAGMLIAPVYRLRVTSIPLHEGFEVYPTLEIIDRLYPPEGQAARFPIVVELTQGDLELALSGRFVTRVVYLEEPLAALPVAETDQRWFDVGPGEDPLRTADELGRPVAILRMGARVPTDTENPGLEFLYGSPPVWKLPAPIDDAAAELLPVDEEARRAERSVDFSPHADAERQVIYYDAPPQALERRQVRR